MRDGRDVAVSFAYHFQSRGKRSRFTSDGRLEANFLKDVARGWAIYAEHILQASNFIDVIQYHTLLLAPVLEMTELFSSLGVSTEKGLVLKNCRYKFF